MLNGENNPNWKGGISKNKQQYYKKYFLKYPTPKSTRAEWQRNYNVRIREKIFALLGHECKKCGFDDKRALQIDHVKGGGIKEIKKVGRNGYYLFVLRSIKLNPNKYQVLCANCNWIKRVENNETNTISPERKVLIKK